MWQVSCYCYCYCYCCCFTGTHLCLAFFFLLINADMILFHCFTYGMYFSTVLYIDALHSRYTRALSVWIFINHPCPDVGLRPSGHHEVVGSLAHTDFSFYFSYSATLPHLLLSSLGPRVPRHKFWKVLYICMYKYHFFLFYHALDLCEHKFSICLLFSFFMFLYQQCAGGSCTSFSAGDTYISARAT